MNKFGNSGAVWNWITVSSSDPEKVALTMKGSAVATVGVMLKLLPLLHVPISADFNTLPDVIYTLTYSALLFAGAGITFVGFVRKVWVGLSQLWSPGSSGGGQLPQG